MKKALFDHPSRWLGILSGCAAAWFLAGCASVDLPTQMQDLGPSYHPSNVYRRANLLPADLKRVALLPLSTVNSSSFLEAGAENLEPILYAELEKVKRFEIIPVTREQMRQWTGQPIWRAEEPLSKDLFDKLRAGTGCDAVMFCQLTRYQPYQPIAVGWKFSLIETPAKSAKTNFVYDINNPFAPPPKTVEASQSPIIWSTDELLDSGDPAVATAARAYYTQHLRNEAPSADVSTMMSSPSRYGQYTIAALLATLPERVHESQ